MTLEEENVILSYLSPFSLHEYHPKYHFRTRLHSSRMCTTHALTVSRGVWGVYLPGLGGGGTCLVWGVPAWSRGVYLPGPGGCTCLVQSWGGVCTCLVLGGTCLVRQGTCLVLGGVLVRYSPPVDRILDTRF